MSGRGSVVIDQLYRWRWLTSAVLVAVFLGLLGPLDKRGPVGWVVLMIAALLLWLPIAVRWAKAACESKKAFQDGLADR